MASRWMQPKLDKIKRMRAPFDPSTTLRRPGHSIAMSNHLTELLAHARQHFQGHVVRLDTGRPLTPQGKGKRQFDAGATLEQYNGGGRRYENTDKQRRQASITTMNSHDRSDLWGSGDRLLRGGKVVD